MAAVSEDDLEQAALTWFAAPGYEVLDGDNLAPESVYRERTGVVRQKSRRKSHCPRRGKGSVIYGMICSSC